MSFLTACVFAPASAHAASFVTSAPVDGATTYDVRAPVAWSGSCDPGFTCDPLTVVSATSAELGPDGRFVLDADWNHYRTRTIDSAAAGSGSIAPLTAYGPARWYVQLQWKRCDHAFVCVLEQSPVTSFVVAARVQRPTIGLVDSYHSIRNMTFQVAFTGNAEQYGARSTVEVWRTGTRPGWRVVYSRRDTMRTTMPSRTTTAFGWFPKRLARPGQRLRLRSTITAPGMRPVVVTGFARSI